VQTLGARVIFSHTAQAFVLVAERNDVLGLPFSGFRFVSRRADDRLAAFLIIGL